MTPRTSTQARAGRVVNDPALAERAEIIREKGTNRSRFLRGQVDKYTWVDVGSSYLMSESSAAVLTAQLGQAEETSGNASGYGTRTLGT